MSGASVFVDTNVLVYAFDLDAGHKRDVAKSVLKELWDRNSGSLSMQVLQEFYTTVTRKIVFPLPRSTARVIINHFSEWSIQTGPAEILRAIEIEDEAQINFWDALIVASAVTAGATRILSEDLNPGQTIAGIMIENPFL